MRKLVIFDFDGTLVDSLRPMLEALHAVLDGEGKKRVSEGMVRRLPPYALLRKAGIPFWKVPRLAKRWRVEVPRHAGAVKAHPGIAELLERLTAEGCTLAIITSNTAAFAESVLKTCGLAQHFAVIEHGGFFTKDRRMRKVRRSLGFPRRDTIYIGDETRDVRAAGRAFITSCAVTWGLHTTELLLGAQPRMIAADTTELGSLLSAWIAGEIK